MNEQMNAQGKFKFVCIDNLGNLKWEEETDNLVVDQGKNYMLDTAVGNSQVALTTYMSLIVSGAAASTTTYSAMGNVTEITGNVITGGLRPQVSWSAAATGSKAATTTSFGVLASATVIGNMLVLGNVHVVGGSNVNAVGNAASTINGILFSSSNFTAGSKNISSGDTINVSYTLSV